MVPFQLLIDYDVVVFVERLTKTDRQNLRARFVSIRDHPVACSDYLEHDAINISGRYAIKFRVDHADRHIKNLDVHLADRRR